MNDLQFALQELEALSALADQGIIDTARWLDYIAYLDKIDCPIAAKSIKLMLQVYKREWKKLQSPAMAEREAK